MDKVEQRIKAMVVMNIIDNCTIELDNTGKERYSLDGNQFGELVDALVKNIKVMPRFSDEEIEEKIKEDPSYGKIQTNYIHCLQDISDVRN